MALGKGGLCRGPQGRPSAKNFEKKKLKTFAEGLTGGPRQRLTGSAAVTQHNKTAEGVFVGRRQRRLCRGPGRRQRRLCRGLLFAKGLSWRPSAKKIFAECPRFGPRQSLRLSAKNEFPVVPTAFLRAQNAKTTADRIMVSWPRTEPFLRTLVGEKQLIPIDLFPLAVNLRNYTC